MGPIVEFGSSLMISCTPSWFFERLNTQQTPLYHRVCLWPTLLSWIVQLQVGRDSPLFLRSFRCWFEGCPLHASCAIGSGRDVSRRRSSGRGWTCLSFLLFASRELSLCEREDQLSLELDGSVAQFFTGRPHNVDLRRVASFALPRVSLGKSSMYLVVARSMHKRSTDSISLQIMLTDCSLLLKWMLALFNVDLRVPCSKMVVPGSSRWPHAL